MKAPFLILLLLISVNPKLTSKDTYPTRHSIKGIQPDFQDPNQLIGNAVHGVAFNFVWSIWQPTQTASCGDGQVFYDGNCFSVQQSTVNHIRAYTDAGVVVTGVIYGVPDWARRPCPSSAVTSTIFCAPNDVNALDYGRFAGFIAYYFNGENGNGRVADFVIHNEVNSPMWFNINCSGLSCKYDHLDTWVATYALSYNNAYDFIKREQQQGKVLISFEHHFGTEWDYNDSLNEVSVQTFLTKLAPHLGDREWKLAYHSYPPNLGVPTFGPNDWPRVTFGNIGVVVGWLMKTFPNKPQSWEVQLTENGINGPDYYYEEQRDYLCKAFRNILGTPYVTSFIYHRLVDIAEEGVNLGLWTSGKSMKPAWALYACANRDIECAGSNDWPACGFEHEGFTVMKRGYNGMHWVSTRMFEGGVSTEGQWRLLREHKSGTTMVYECKVGDGHSIISKDPGCEGQFPMGPMGYIYDSHVDGTEAIYRCYDPNSGDHLISSDSNCEGYNVEWKVGYAYTM